MGPRAGLDGRKISSPPGFDPGPSSPLSVAMPTELPGPRIKLCKKYKYRLTWIIIKLLGVKIAWSVRSND